MDTMTFDPSVYTARRTRIFEELERRGGGVLLLPAADEKLRNNDAEYLFRQDSDYAWAVGLDEPTAAQRSAFAAWCGGPSPAGR